MGGEKREGREKLEDKESQVSGRMVEGGGWGGGEDGGEGTKGKN